MQKSGEEIRKARPISPHLTIYKPQISSVLSIDHRLSGIGLFFMFSALGWWFILLVFSKFDPVYLKIFDSFFVKFLLILTSYAFFLSFMYRNQTFNMGYRTWFFYQNNKLFWLGCCYCFYIINTNFLVVCLG